MNPKPSNPPALRYWLIESTTLNWPHRLLLTCVAFAGSAIYAGSFAPVPQREQWMPVASGVGIAAGVSWVLFGLLLLAVTRCQPSVLAWADACLVTMAAGIAVKMTTVAANFISPPGAWFHIVVLLIANLTMATIFIWRAQRLAMRPLLAAGLWFGALNGCFVVVMLALRAGGWFH